MKLKTKKNHLSKNNSNHFKKSYLLTKYKKKKLMQIRKYKLSEETQFQVKVHMKKFKDQMTIN